MKKFFSSIFAIFKYIGKFITFFRNALFNVLFLVLLVIFLVALFSSEDISIEENSALLLAISGNIVEQKQEADPFNEMLNESLGISSFPEETLLQDILDSINTAASDPQIGSIILDMSKMKRSTFDQIYDIGESLLEFRDSGKKVIAAENFYTQNKYLLATYADKIFLNPMGAVDLHGIGRYRLYYNEAIEKLRINYHIFRVGTYKSALEPLMRNSMSSEAKLQNELWLKELWGNITQEIINRRNLKPEIIDLYTNNIAEPLKQSGGNTAQLAVDVRLVDELKSRNELRKYFNTLTDSSPDSEFKHVTLKEYIKTITPSYSSEEEELDRVGIIIAQGNILNGKQPSGTIGGESLSEVIHQARQDSTIKAVVLRINSGGGSVFASEMIRRELQELRDEGKPLVISMGALAASGGYWISAEADQIWAYPTTLTGSIGIFGAIPTFEETLSNLGVFSDGIGTTKLASGLDLSRPLSEETEDSIQLSINHGYRKFLEIVTNGREFDPLSLESVTQGRVFAGNTAKKLGLVDEIGNLKMAIEASAELAALSDYTAVYIKLPMSLSEKFFQQLQTSIHSILFRIELPEPITETIKTFLRPIAAITYFDDPKGIYAHCMIDYY